jgi:hypothetical protein
VFPPTVRKAVLAAHVAASVGWMGAVLAFVALDVATVASDDAATLRAAYIGMELVTRWVIVPLAALAVVSGVAVSLGGKWGLFRHYWVVLSLVLTVVATLVLAVQLPVIGHRAGHARDPSTTDDELRGMGNLLLHSVGGTVLLAVILVLNVAKPRGLTRYGWRRQREEATSRTGPGSP